MNKVAYLIANIEDYGKLMAFCIKHDICVFRTYWDEREKGKRCYSIDWVEKRCYYSSIQYFKNNGYEIVSPTFCLDEYGNYYISKE